MSEIEPEPTGKIYPTKVQGVLSYYLAPPHLVVRGCVRGNQNCTEDSYRKQSMLKGRS
jgi:hypothetical protein